MPKVLTDDVMLEKLDTEISDCERYIKQHKDTIKVKTAEKEIYALRIRVRELESQVNQQG